MFTRLNGSAHLEQIFRAPLPSASTGPDEMGPGVRDPVVRSNRKATFPQGAERHQSYPAPSSSPSNAQFGLEKATRSLKLSKRGLNRCNTPAESSRHSTDVLPHYDATCGRDDFDPTKSTPQISDISTGTISPVSEPKSHTEKKHIPSSSIDTIPAAAASEPMDRPPVAADRQPADDDPIYSIGEMKVYDQKQKAIPKLYEARWQVIRPDIFDRVHNRLGRGRFAVRLNKPKAPTIIELMSAGVTTALSIPAVVVVIPKHIKTMQDFLNTDSTVQNRCRPDDGTTVELMALACKASSALIGMPSESLRNDTNLLSDSESDYFSGANDSLNSASDSDSSAGLHSTPRIIDVNAQSVSVAREVKNFDGDKKHGMGILLIMKDGSRYVRGTCGGLLQLMMPNQPPRQVGLMAGHLLEQFEQGSEKGKQNSTDFSRIIGDIVYPRSSAEVPRHDWALFDAAKLNFEHDMANQDGWTVAQESEFPEANTAVVIRTSRGDMNGTLSSSTSGLMLNPNHGFVHARTVMMDKGSFVTRGDSGAWVFQEGDEKVYGYIIATNGNEHAYMVPLHAAIAEMQIVLDAASVSLAVSTDPASQPQLKLHPGPTHEQVEQTEQSILTTKDDELTQSATLNCPVGVANVATKNPNDRRPKEMISVISLPKQYLQEDTSQLQLQNRLAKTYLENGRVLEAIKILESVVSTCENILGEDHPVRLVSEYELAVAYTQNGQTTKAITILEHVVKKEAEVLDKSDIGCLTSQHELARAYLADGQVSGAVQLLQYVVSMKSSILDGANPHLLASKVVLAEAHLAAGLDSEAIDLLNHVAAVTQATPSGNEEIRAVTSQWLRFAYSRRHGLGFTRFSAQQSRPLPIIIIRPRK